MPQLTVKQPESKPIIYGLASECLSNADGDVEAATCAKALEKGLTPMHAENRGKRHMSKALLRDLSVEWRRVAGQLSSETLTTAAGGAFVSEDAG